MLISSQSYQSSSNLPAPINVSSDTQTKTGGLNIATGGGNVGIGKTNPGTALDVAGTVTATQLVGGGAGITGITVSEIPWSSITSKPTAITRIQDLTGSYGSINIAGTIGGYAGINFVDEGLVLMMDAAGATGVYTGSAWKWYFNTNGVLTVGTVPGASVSGAVASATYAATAGNATQACAICKSCGGSWPNQMGKWWANLCSGCNDNRGYGVACAAPYAVTGTEWAYLCCK